MPFRVVRDLLFLVPADVAAVEAKQKPETFAVKNTKKNSSLEWKVVSVGDGTIRDGKLIPIPLKLGDIVILTLTDTECRDAWNSTEVSLNGERGLTVTYDTVFAKLEPDSSEVNR